MTRAWLSLCVTVAALIAISLRPVVLSGGEIPEHWHLVHVIGRLAGLSPDDARLVADASWAMDQNNDTVATGHGEEFAAWLARTAAASAAGSTPPRTQLLADTTDGDGRMLGQGVLGHALSSDEARKATRALFERYMEDQVRAHAGSPREHQLRLVLLGMHLHAVVDSYVHPGTAVPGHAGAGHQPDRVPNQPGRYLEAAADVFHVLSTSPIVPAGARADRTALRLRYSVDADGGRALLAEVIDAVSAGYAATPVPSPLTMRRFADWFGAQYGEYMSGGVPLADLIEVSTKLQLWWDRAIQPSVHDNQLGRQWQREDPYGHQDLVYYRSGRGRLRITIPGVPHTWQLPSFAAYATTDAGDGLDAQREIVRTELAGQSADVVEASRDTVLPFVPPAAVHVIAREAAGAALTVIVGGSGSVAEPARGPARPRLRMPSDPTERIIIEVHDRGWSTDGLEKYLKPKSGPDQPARIQAPAGGAALTPEVTAAIAAAMKPDRPTTVIVETANRQPGEEAQTRRAAEIAVFASQHHAEVAPEGARTLYAEGSGSDVLAHVPASGPAGLPPFPQRIAISPLQPPASIPAGVTVLLHHDSRFMNFDSGSPGYQRIAQRAETYAKTHDVVVVPSSAGPVSSGTSTVPLTFYARGGDGSVTLTNSSASDVVSLAQASPSARQSIVASVVRAEQREKPSNVGGISLVRSATLPLDPKDVMSATYDTSRRRLVLRTRHGDVTLPETDPELTRIAFDCFYAAATPPEVSIGVNPTPERPVKEVAGWSNVYYVSAIEGTELGQIMLNADRLLGALAYGGSDVPASLGIEALGIHTLPEIFPFRYADPRPRLGGGGRVYLVPSRIELRMATATSLAFHDTAFDIRLEPFGPAEEAFSRAVLSRWDALLATEAGRPFRDLVPAAQVVGVMHWLHANMIPFDDSLAALPKRQVPGESVVRATGPVRRASLNSRRPLVRYGTDGIEQVWDTNGGLTRVSYRAGRLHEIHRNDAAILRVYWNDLGEPAAIADSREPLGAAFYLADNGRPAMADLVSLRVEPSGYTGFARTARSRDLYDVEPQRLLTAVAANFIAETQPDPLPESPRRPWRTIAVVCGGLALLWFLLQRRSGARI